MHIQVLSLLAPCRDMVGYAYTSIHNCSYPNLTLMGHYVFTIKMCSDYAFHVGFARTCYVLIWHWYSHIIIWPWQTGVLELRVTRSGCRHAFYIVHKGHNNTIQVPFRNRYDPSYSIEGRQSRQGQLSLLHRLYMDM